MPTLTAVSTPTQTGPATWISNRLIGCIGGLIKQEQPQEASQEVRPTWLPEKFKSPEDLAVAYGELEIGRASCRERVYVLV